MPWLFALLLQIVGFADLRHDDAFITFRYGQNLASGHGLVFNPGERIMGSTSPGEALISALVYSFAGLEHTPTVMAAIGCAAWTAQAIALWLLLRPSLGPIYAGSISACVIAGASSAWAWVALETNLAVALTLFALLLAERSRWTLVAALCGCAALVRPDSLLLTALLGLRAMLEGRGSPVRAQVRALARPAAVLIAIVLPWILFALAWFGDPLPRSLRAKLQRSALGDYASHMLDSASSSLLGTAQGVSGLACIALAVFGAAVLIRKRRALSWLVAYGALHFAAYAVLRSVAGHDWHLYPGVLIAAVLSVTAVLTVVERIASKLAGPSPARQASWARTALLIAGIGLTTAYAQRTASAALMHDRARWNGARDSVYRSLGEHMRAHSRPGELFASVEVGTLAYYTQLPAFDIGMLVTNRKQRPASHIRWVVLDDAFLGLAPPFPAVGDASTPQFRAHLFEVPQGTSYFDILHARLAASRAAAAR